MLWPGLLQSEQGLLLAGGGLALALLWAGWWVKTSYRSRCLEKETFKTTLPPMNGHYPFGFGAATSEDLQWGGAFPEFLAPLILKDEPFPPPNGQMLDALIGYRFPFTPLNLGPDFPKRVKDILQSLPPVLIQLLYKHRVPIELDVVCDIPAMMDPEGPRLMLSRFFVMDAQLYEIEANPVFSYGLPSILMHELGHFLDWFLDPATGRLSATPAFLAAFDEDVQAIPPALVQSFETCNAWRETYGGYLKLPQDLRYQSDLSLFINQEEEVFGEAFVYCMTGATREVVMTHFPKTLTAVKALLTQGFQSAARAAYELPTP